MSAFIVSKRHLDYLIQAGLTLGIARNHGPLTWMAPREAEPAEPTHQRGEPWGPGWIAEAQARHRQLTRETADQVGSVLAAENRASVNYRYATDELEDLYTYAPAGSSVDPVQVLKAIACYEYQSCETPDWKDSEAHAFCRALESRAIDALPGYEDAHWEIPAEAPKPKPRRRSLA